MRRFRHLATLLLFVGPLVLAAADTQAATITLAYDPFDDGGVTAGADPQDVAWRRNTGTGPFFVVADSVFGSNAMSWQTDHSFRAVTSTPFGSYTVGASGKALELTFDFRFAGYPPNDPGGLRFGLYNSQGTTGTNDDQGYYISVSTGGTMNHSLFREAGGLTDITAGVDRTQLGPTNQTAPSLVAEQAYSMLMRLEDDVAGLRIIAAIDGIEYFNYLDTSPNRFLQFDQIAFGNANTTNATLRFDNVAVTSVVPEPSTYALALLGGIGLGILAWRKRRRATAMRSDVC